MAKLTAAARKKIPAKDFALGKGRYPIENASHARNALSRVSANGSPAEKAEVRAKVHAKYPGIGSSNKPGESKSDRASRLDKWTRGK
jgi:hypothetical protein